MGALRRLMLISGERATAKGVEITGECAEFDLVPAGADPPPLYNAVFENRSPLPPKIEFRRVQGG